MLTKYINKLFFPREGCSFCKKPNLNLTLPKSDNYLLNQMYRLSSICASCKKELEIPAIPFCLYCHKPMKKLNKNANNLVCEDCKNVENRYLVHNRSALLYNNYIKDYIALYKYRGKQSLAKEFSYLLKLAYDYYYKNTDINLLTYIPMHNNRLQERGFNQSELLANMLSELIGIPVIDCLERTKDTYKQSKQSKEMRFKQIGNSFSVKNDTIYKIRDKNILIIDDIYTTGSTTSECANMLKKVRANDIYSLTLTRAYDS